MKTDRLGSLGRCRRLREQRRARELGRERRLFHEIEGAFERARQALDDNRRKRRQREQQIHRAIGQRPVPVDRLETLRWELAAMELQIERLMRTVEAARVELTAAAAKVERVREAYLRDMHAARKWDQVVERTARGEQGSKQRLAEFEQDDANVDRILHRERSATSQR